MADHAGHSEPNMSMDMMMMYFHGGYNEVSGDLDFVLIVFRHSASNNETPNRALLTKIQQSA